MSTRRHPTADHNDSLEREHYYRDGHRPHTYDEVDTELSTSTSTRDLTYVRERERPARREREVEQREEQLVVRRGERDRYRRDVEHGHDEDEVDVVTTTVRREHREPPPQREPPREVVREVVREVREPPREVVREVVREVRDDHHRSAARRGGDEIDVLVRRDERGGGGRRAREVEDVDVRLVRHDDRRDHQGRGREYDFVDERESVLVRERSRARHHGRETEGEEEIVLTRRRGGNGSDQSSPRRRTVDKETIVIKKSKERSPSPVEVQVVRPPIVQEIHQEVITHHRHIDHGVERARSRSPLPPPKAPRRKDEETIEVDIRHRHGRNTDEEDIVIDRLSPRDAQRSLVVRDRSRSRSRVRYRDEPDDYDTALLESEARALNARAMERAYAGEAHDGATRDWAIVDVPPGTQRVRMDGAGGGAQEITWRRYNGVRRSRFLVGDRAYDDGGRELLERGLLPGMRREREMEDDLWTEITKDLVSRDALEAMGYEYEETEYFFYVMEYLLYEDVMRLVQLSDELRRERRRRIRQIELERAELAELRARNRKYDDRIYEREVVVDRRRR